MLAPIKRSLFITIWLLAGLSTAFAQDDPNGQYVTIVSATLNGETREINAPIEPTVLRLFFIVQAQGEITWEIISPLKKPAALNGGNVSVTDANGKRTIALWDPRPGLWKLRLTGTGAFTAQVLSQSEVYACCMNIVGRQLQPLEKVQVARGSNLQATVYVSGNNLETVDFQLINEQGEIIAPIKFRQSDYSNPQNFALLIEVPAQPCRVLVRGREQNGGYFQRVYPQLILPQVTTANPAPETNPAKPASSMAQEWQQRMTEGEYRIVRAQVISSGDESLLSANGNPIGIRLKFAVRFPAEGYYAPHPNLYPERIPAMYTGALSMRVIRSTVEPLPEGAQQQNQVLYSGRTVYKRDQVYQFTVDLVPNYVIYHEAQQKYCLAVKGYNQGGMRERFEREVRSESAMRYRLSISGTDYDGRQPVFSEKTYIPSLWYASLQKEGAGECQ